MIHPIVAQMRPDPEQESAILDRGRDVVVTAGAGTGKTRTLVARYLSLVAEGMPLRSVVAITFTRKAAREMRNRVREEVRRYLGQDGLTEAESTRWQVIYTALDAARIGTIHTLCAEILHAHPAQAEVDPRFEVLDDARSNVIRARSVEETLGWAADDEQGVTLFELLDPSELRDTLDALIKRRFDARDAFGSLPTDGFTHWESVLHRQQRRDLDSLVSRDDWQDAVATVRAVAANDPADKMEIQRQAALAALGEPLGSLDERLASLSGLAEIKLSGGSQKKWPGGREDVAAVKGALRTLRDLWKGQSQALALHLTEIDSEIAGLLPVLHRAFDVACGRYESYKDKQRSLDFDDLEYRALALLQDHAAALARWRREVRAVLVDEFQDTNGRQRDLVKLLSGGSGNLFIVGDAKQSIYRFRGADVTIFRAERERIKRRGGAVYSLQTSYRAHQELVQGLNDLLRPVLGEEADPERPWAEPFAALVPHRREASPGFSSPHVELHLTVGSKSGGALDRAADALAARIVDLMEQGVQVEGARGPRDLTYGDVALLCRASSSFAAYEDALERAGVPFLTVAGRGFYGRPEIRDLLNALQALADPADDLALVGLLRSPACGFSDEAIYRLCEHRDGADPLVALWEALQEAPATREDEDGARARRAVSLVADLHERVGRFPVADVLKALLDATDYRAALIQAGQSRGARNASKLLADAHASGIVGVGEFLEYVTSLRDTGTREGEARATAEGVVQIMSVHAAKGLEFPVVAIGDITGSARGRSGVLIDPELGILLPKKDAEGCLAAAYQLGKARADAQEDAEMERLLYVAATRARELLLISGCFRIKKDGTPGRLTGWLGKLGSSSCLGLVGTTIPHDEEGALARQFVLQAGETPVACTIYEPHVEWIQRTPKIRQAVEPSILPPVLLGRVDAGHARVDERVEEESRDPPRRVWRVVPVATRSKAPRWVVGSIVHVALAAWRFPAGRLVEGDSFPIWAEARARGYGITDPRELADAVKRSRNLLLRFRAHELYEEMNGAQRLLHEVPYSLMIDGVVESGMIDALYLTDNAWTIVEYKTDEVKDRADFNRLLEDTDYQAQAERYLSAVEKLVGERPRCVLCLLNWGGGVHLHWKEMGSS